MTSKTYDPAPGECHCNHVIGYLFDEIAAGRWVHEMRETAPLQQGQPNGAYVLVCLTCLGAWDHRATDRLIEANASSFRNNCRSSNLGK
jgi:hypothetical protein